MNTGKIVKTLSGFYYVKTDEKLVSCKPRGKFRHIGLSPLVGDTVDFVLSGDDGIIEEIHPRKNSFIRPAVSNVDVIVFVAANAIPITDPLLIDRMSVIAEKAGCEFIVCLNKCDLDYADELFSIYSGIDCKVCRCSAETGEGLDNLMSFIEGRTSVFTGNSGVGKTSLLNAIIPSIELRTNDVSIKLGRGKHTTTHVEIFPVDNSTYIIDTPGFATLDLNMVTDIEKKDLSLYFKDIYKYHDKCRFDNCVHINDSDCGVIPLVGTEITGSRYKSYVRLYEDLKK